MWPFFVARRSQGFTLFELLVVFIIFGMLAVMIGPSVVGLQNRSRVNAAFDNLRQALREAQAQALKQSQKCTVNLETAQDPVAVSAVNSANQPCIVNRSLLPGVAVATNFAASPTQVMFTYRGSTAFPASENQANFVAVVYWKESPDLQKKCVVLPRGGIGIIRTGNYTSTVENLAADNCEVSP